MLAHSQEPKTGLGWPRIQVTHDNTIITQSCVVSIPEGLVIEDLNQDGVIQVRADGVTIRFADRTVLRGAPSDRPPDQVQGTGIRIDGHERVVLENLDVRGFRVGVDARRADRLTLQDARFSDLYRQHLMSTPVREEGGDWLFPHHNDETKWRDEYGGAICVESSRRVTLRRVQVRRGQNGIVCDRVDQSEIYDNDCSFLSGWGLAFWRSSRNVVSRNAFDFCIRGHSEGVYNRGQDSAGILCFEQSQDNVFAENSVTHGGDGFFGFAGRDAIGELWMDQERARLRRERGREDVEALIQVPDDVARSMSQLGCNGNILLRNDFSYAAAHGIEMTFSLRNQLIDNRIVENGICGFWGGYSSETLIAGNQFVGNGGMANGGERGAINMEHASRNRILNNRFLNNRCGIYMWWDDDGALMRFPGLKNRELGVVGNVIAQNQFEFEATNAVLPVGNRFHWIALQLHDVGGVHVRSNYYGLNTLRLDHPQSVELDLTRGIELNREVPATALKVAKPSSKVIGTHHPVGMRDRWKGREEIVMGEWGPWDHQSPFIRKAQSGASTALYEAYGVSPASSPQISVVQGAVKTQTENVLNGQGRRFRVEAEMPNQVTDYVVRVQADDLKQEFRGSLLKLQWKVAFFPWSEVDPRVDLVGWRALESGTKTTHLDLDSLDLVFGMEGPEQALKGRSWVKALGRDHFGCVARTHLRLPKGKWRFRTLSDDGIRVVVGDRAVIENWTWHGPTPNEGVYESVGDMDVPVRVEYFEIDGYAVLQLEVTRADR